MGKVRPLLRKHRPVMEDFRANISAYKRQHYAIRALHDDNYSSKNLKDILLNLDEPTYTPFLQNIKFSKALSIIQRTMPECSRDKIVQVKTEYYLSLVFDEKYIITGVAKDIVIMDSNTHIHKVEFYLQVM